MKQGRVAGLVLGLALSLVSKADHVSDSLKTRECLALYQDELKMKNYEGAKEPLEWLLVHQPDLGKSIYIDAVKVYEYLAKNVSNSNEREYYQSLVLDMYFKRIEKFGEKKKVFNYMAYKAYGYYRSDSLKRHYLFQLMDSALYNNKENTFPANLLAYTDLLQLSSQNENGELNILKRYLELETLIASSHKLRADSSFFVKYASLKNRLISTAGWSCEDLDDMTKDIRVEFDYLSKSLISLYYKRKCSGSEVYRMRLLEMHNKNPSPGISYYLGGLYLKHGDISSAEHYYLESLALEKDSLSKPGIFLSLARIGLKKRNKPEALKWASKALNYPETAKLANIFIGDLFFNSYEECKKLKSKVYDRACFILAYKYYKEAQQQKKMKMAINQFPTRVELFEEGREVGAILKWNCWITTEVTLLEKPIN